MASTLATVRSAHARWTNLQERTAEAKARMVDAFAAAMADGWTAEQIAAEIGMSKQFVYLEMGRRRNGQRYGAPAAETAKKAR